MENLRNISTRIAGPEKLSHTVTQDLATSSWNHSPKPRDASKKGFSDIYSAIRTPRKQVALPSSMNTESSITAGSVPHYQLTGAKTQTTVEPADILDFGELPAAKCSSENPLFEKEGKANTESSSQPTRIFITHPSHPTMLAARRTQSQFAVKNTSSPPHKIIPPSPALTVLNRSTKKKETAQDHAQRINQEIKENEQRLSETKAPGYVPPHLRPAPRKPARGTEDVHGNYILPHLRNPKENDRRTCSSNPTTGWGTSSHEPSLVKPHKVSVVLTPISCLPESPADTTPSLIGATNPVSFTMPSQPYGLTSTEHLVQSNRATYHCNPKIPKVSHTHEPPLATNPMLSQLNPPTSQTASALPSPVGAAKTRTAYFPLRSETPSPPPSNRRDETSSYGCQDSYLPYRSFYNFNGRPIFGQNKNRDNNFMLDHVGARKLRSYTRYRSKPSFAPHHPRLPFEFLHKIYGQSEATYSATLGERHDSSSMIGPRSIPIPGKTYCRPSAPQGRASPNDSGNGCGVPERQHAETYNRTIALSSGSISPTIEEIDDLFSQGWPRPSKSNVCQRHQNARSVILSGLPSIPTLSHVSKVCEGTGRIEDIQIDKEHRMGQVTFVEASTAYGFYETAGARGVSLVYIDDETNEIMRTQVYINMSPEIVITENTVRQIIDVKNGSRTLEVVGWTRDILETLVGDLFDGAGVGYSDLLMTLASRDCPAERVQCIDWRQNEEGHMEAKIVYAGIKDAMAVRKGLDKESALKECDIFFGSDLCETKPYELLQE